MLKLSVERRPWKIYFADWEEKKRENMNQYRIVFTAFFPVKSYSLCWRGFVFSVVVTCDHTLPPLYSDALSQVTVVVVFFSMGGG